MRRNLLETLMGGLVLVVGLGFLMFAYSRADLGTAEGYDVIARFDQVDGIKSGAEVRMAGIKIGTVTGQQLDTRTYFAVVSMTVRDDVKLPTDSSAKITSDGLLGDKYITITPGGLDEMIKPGGQIQHTQGSIDLISLVGQAIFSQTEGSKDGTAAGGGCNCPK